MRPAQRQRQAAAAGAAQQDIRAACFDRASGYGGRIPQQGPFLSQYFSLYDGRRFDLGLYEAGSKRTVLFDRPGISYLFCNIHAEMSAVIVAVETPYFGLSGRSGHVAISNVPDGRYQLNVWYERSLPETLNALTRTIAISNSNRNLGQIRVLENPNFTPRTKISMAWITFPAES